MTAFFDLPISVTSYFVKDPESYIRAIVDPVSDLGGTAVSVTCDHANGIIEFVSPSGPEIEWLIEANVHADRRSSTHGRTIADGRQCATQPARTPPSLATPRA